MLWRFLWKFRKKSRGCCVDLLRTVPILSTFPKQIFEGFGEQNPAYIRVKIRPSRKFLRQGSVYALSPQVQKLCQQAEQEKDFHKLLLLVSQINHVLKSQPPPSKEMLQHEIDLR